MNSAPDFQLPTRPMVLLRVLADPSTPVSHQDSSHCGFHTNPDSQVYQSGAATGSRDGREKYRGGRSFLGLSPLFKGF